MTFINGLFAAAAIPDMGAAVWLGLTKGLTAGFQWDDGTALQYDNWDLGEPSDSDNGLHQDCVQAAANNGRWNDVDCFSQNYYLCKTIKHPPSTMAQGTTPYVAQRTTRVNPQTTRRPNVNPWTPPPRTQPRPVRTTRYVQRTTPRTWAPYTPYTQAPQRTGGPGYQPTASPLKQGGGSGSGDSGLSGGAVAGIVLGTLVIVGLAGAVAFLMRGRLTQASRQNNPNTGFDNALYSNTKQPTDSSAKGAVSFGFDADDIES